MRRTSRTVAFCRHDSCLGLQFLFIQIVFGPYYLEILDSHLRPRHAVRHLLTHHLGAICGSVAMWVAGIGLGVLQATASYLLFVGAAKLFEWYTIQAAINRSRLAEEARMRDGGGSRRTDRKSADA